MPLVVAEKKRPLAETGEPVTVTAVGKVDDHRVGRIAAVNVVVDPEPGSSTWSASDRLSSLSAGMTAIGDPVPPVLLTTVKFAICCCPEVTSVARICAGWVAALANA